MPKLYHELASWWPLLSAPEDYREEAAFFSKTIRDRCRPPVQSILELGSGGGNTASFMKKDFQLTLVDLSPEMLAVSCELNPECEHREGDMRTVRLNRQFDAVFVHDAIMYMTTESDLARVMETVICHCKPGGVALFSPDWIRETFSPGTDHGGHDAVGRGLRYLEWTFDPDPEDSTYQVEFAILLRETDGSIRLVQDRHTLGLFPRETWLKLMRQNGLRTEIIIDPYQREIFVGVKY